MKIAGSIRMGAVVAATLTFTATASAAELTEVWRADGFKMPESAAYDPSSGAFFVSNINSPQFQANGEGYVSLVDPLGRLVVEKFVDGLNAPKGM